MITFKQDGDMGNGKQDSYYSWENQRYCPYCKNRRVQPTGLKGVDYLCPDCGNEFHVTTVNGEPHAIFDRDKFCYLDSSNLSYLISILKDAQCGN